MHIHFIAIGGAAMHNLALALHGLGNSVTGSDDEIKEPSLSRLAAAGILPSATGWYPEKLETRPDAVILGMHARADNPELLKAKELGLKIYSFPEYFYEHAKNKTRIVIGGSHGKTSITAMIMHVLRDSGVDFDYMVGSSVAGFDTMVRLSNSADLMVLEGDEYLASPIDRRPKFHLYKPDIAVLSGIAWDHINVFPTFDNYVEQFRIFADMLPSGGSLIYYKNDPELNKIAAHLAEGINKIPYSVPDSKTVNGITSVIYDSMHFPLNIFGDHNLANLNAAMLVCEQAGIERKQFLTSIGSFTGAARRLETIKRTDDLIVIRDFAHSPSKLRATVDAVKKQYPDWHLVACMELHTFSSLSENFLDQYSGTMDLADVPLVYFNPETLIHKKLKSLDPYEVKNAFNNSAVSVINNPEILHKTLTDSKLPKTVFLMMSSGTFDGLDLSLL
ncbi:MAG TPA: Mur ligase family protein [Bacteroidia bacterium]|nr:Mur ligase family protein [Bacteroidia bacterium]